MRFERHQYPEKAHDYNEQVMQGHSPDLVTEQVDLHTDKKPPATPQSRLVPMDSLFNSQGLLDIVTTEPLDFVRFPEWPAAIVGDAPLHAGDGHGLGKEAFRHLGPICPGDFIFVGASRAGGGKSALVMQLAFGLALRNLGELEDGAPLSPVIVASEMPPPALAMRDLSRWLGVSVNSFREGRKANQNISATRKGGIEQGNSIHEAALRTMTEGAFAKARKQYLFSFTTTAQGEEWLEQAGTDIRNLKTQMAALYNRDVRDVLPVFFVDPAQRFQDTGNEIEALNELTRGLANLCTREGIVVVATSDTNKDSAARDRKKDPNPAGYFRGSYVASHMATVVAVLEPELTDKKEHAEVPHAGTSLLPYHLVVVKSRFGPTRPPWLRLGFHPRSGRFVALPPDLKIESGQKTAEDNFPF